MSKRKQYDSVSDLVHDISDDTAFSDAVDQEIDEQRMATMLFLMRNREGLTQAELAMRMGCTQSRISKLERAPLSSISMQDLMDVSTALGIDVNIIFQKMKAATPRFSIIREHDVDEELERELGRVM